MRPSFPATFADVSVKICGLTRLEDALACAEAGVHAIGINFYPKSKRYHALEAATAWLDKVPETLNRVAVLVNNPREEIDALCASGLIDTLQFHGNEPDEVLQHYQSRGMPCIRALSLREEADFEQLAFSVTNKLLLDAYHPTDFGGTGTACDWGLARQAVRQFPKQKIILSGGLSPENVAQAIRQVRPCAVDVASGVESSPGIKDAAKIQDFMRQVLAAAE